MVYGDRMSEPAVSVIIVNWNGKIWLERCINSLLKQAYPNLEIVVVDNASSDGSHDLLVESFPDVRLIQSDQNLGFAGGNNLGIKHSQGEYILLLNNDTWIDTDFVEKALGYLRTQNLDVVGAVEVPYEGESIERPLGWTIDLLGHPVNFVLGDRQQFYLSGCCILFSRAVYQETGGLDSDFFMYFEEIDWFWRLHLLGKRIAVISSLQVHHAGHGSSGSTASLSANRFLWRNENCLAMLIKNYSAINLCWVLPLYLGQNIGEALIFLLLGRVEIARTYWLGLNGVLQRMNTLLEKRAWVQRTRLHSDKDIIRLMYKGPGKLHHLVGWLRAKRG